MEEVFQDERIIRCRGSRRRNARPRPPNKHPAPANQHHRVTDPQLASLGSRAGRASHPAVARSDNAEQTARCERRDGNLIMGTPPAATTGSCRAGRVDIGNPETGTRVVAETVASPLAAVTEEIPTRASYPSVRRRDGWALGSAVSGCCSRHRSWMGAAHASRRPLAARGSRGFRRADSGTAPVALPAAPRQLLIGRWRHHGDHRVGGRDFHARLVARLGTAERINKLVALARAPVMCTRRRDLLASYSRKRHRAGRLLRSRRVDLALIRSAATSSHERCGPRGAAALVALNAARAPWFAPHGGRARDRRNSSW